MNSASTKSFSRASSFIAISVGCLVLVGWAFDIVALKSVLPGLVTMKANTALAFVLLGMSLWLLQPVPINRSVRCFAQFEAGTAALIGLLTLSEYLFGWNLGIDQLLFKELPEAAKPFPPDRMAPATALNFLMLGIALLLLGAEARRSRYSSQSLTLLAGLISLLSLSGYLYNEPALTGGFSYTRMSLHTAPTFIILCSAILCARPDQGPMAVITSDYYGGVMARRLLVSAFTIPLILGWLRLQGEWAGFYGVEFGLSLMVISSIVIFTTVIWWNARSLNLADSSRGQAEEEIRLLQSITQAISEAKDFHTALEITLRKVCEVTGWIYGEAWIPEADGTRLECASEWYRGAQGLEKFREGSKEFMFSPGVGLPGRVWVSKKPLWVRDVTLDSNFPRASIAREAGLISAMGIPIPAGDQVIAVMNYFVRQQREEDRHLTGLVSAIATQLGLAFQRKLAEEQTLRNLDRIQALNEIDLAITSTLDLRTILDILLEKTDRLLPFVTATTVRLLNRETGELAPVACRNLDEEEWKVATAGVSTKGLAGIFSEKNTPEMVLNAQTDPRSLAPEFLRKYRLVSSLRVPLVAKEEVLGALTFFTKAEHEFANEEVEFLTTLAGQAAIAIHNSQLFEEVQKKSQELQRANRERENIMETVPDIIYMLDLDGKLVTWNRQVEMVTGLLPEELKGKDALEFFPEEDQPTIAQAIRWAFEKGQAEVEGRLLRKDGTTIPYHWTGRTLKDDLGNVIGLTGIGRDITTWKQTEEKSKRLLEEFSKKSHELEVLVKINRGIAALLDREILLPRIAEEAKKILKADSPVFRVIEGESLVLMGSPDSQSLNFRPRLGLNESLAGKVIRENRVVAIRNVLEDPTIIEEHRKIVRKGGYRSFLGVPLRAGARTIGTLNFLSKEEREFQPEEIDLITAFADQAAISVENSNLFAEVKNKTSLLEKTNIELQEANRVKTEFVAAVSHELRTPLQVIMSYTSLVKDGIVGEVNEEQQHALKTILHYSDILNKLISNVLTLTKADAQKIPLDISTGHLEEVLEPIRSYVEHLNHNNRRKFLWKVEENLPLVTTDFLKLEEILQNLIGNAYKFTPEGRVELRVRDLPEKGRVEFVVFDTGIGIEKSDLTKIFDKFYQAKGAHTGDNNGVGLGLSIVKKYLSLMQGEIKVESQRGKGTTCTFTLPYSISEQSVEKGPSALLRSTGSL